MTITSILENLTKSYLSPSLARLAKRIAVYPRYHAQVRACQCGYTRYGHCYSQHVLFIAGLPKSGTTWLEKMISSYLGFHNLLIPDVAGYELTTGGSHDYDLPEDMFLRFKEALVLTKMHVHGSPHNVEILRQAQVKYVVLYRDLRDVAVSHLFYVRQTPWHPEYPLYAKLSVSEGLAVFGQRLLSAYMAWVRSWHSNRDPEVSLELRYEQMLVDTEGVLTRVAEHFQLDSSPETIKAIAEAHRFGRLSGGRGQGQEDARSFFRKGVAGDWRNHFTPALKEFYKKQTGDFLIEFGYEQDYNW